MNKSEQLIACLEGEIAKRDARIVELDKKYGWALSELAAIKAQDTVGEVVGWYRLDRPYEMTSYPSVCATWHKLGAPVAPVYAAHVQQVSVPDGFRVMNPTSAVVRDGDRWEIYAPCGSGGIVHEDDVRDWVVRKLLDAIAAAPAAPAADAGDVLEQAMYTLISIGYHENSGLVHELRQALAAHRAKGVV